MRVERGPVSTGTRAQDGVQEVDSQSSVGVIMTIVNPSRDTYVDVVMTKVEWPVFPAVAIHREHAQECEATGYLSRLASPRVG